MVTSGGNTALVAGIQISCPKDIPISVSYTTSSDCDNKYGAIGESKQPDVSFYKDASCTEVWKPGQAESYCFTDKNRVVTKNIYCKTNKNNIKLLEGQSVVIYTIKLEY